MNIFLIMLKMRSSRASVSSNIMKFVSIPAKSKSRKTRAATTVHPHILCLTPAAPFLLLPRPSARVDEYSSSSMGGGAARSQRSKVRNIFIPLRRLFNTAAFKNYKPQLLQINKYMLLRCELFVLNAENEKTACFPLAICQNSGTIYLALKVNEC